ncbi:MAG TPA: response regulator [Patescibacteria group bacterium]|nr:response regulator [Patescibacteria group bacterium]
MGKKQKILIAEDDKFISRAYGNGLQQAGFEVLIATDGVKAKEMIKKKKPDLILLDLIMPEKDGFDVLKEIKKDSKLKKIPVLILSNLGQDPDIEKGKELGAVDYLVKTDYSMSKVIDKIKSCLE